jgi:hypothetical protein
LIYHTDENWVFISRDLLNIPRRWLLDFQIPYTRRDNLAATLAGWSIFLSVVGCTIWLTLRRKDRHQALTGPPAAFLLLGAWMSCFHFMYYDLLLTALPVLLLLAEPRPYFRPILVGVLPLSKATLEGSLTDYFQPRLASTYPSSTFFPHAVLRNICVLNSLTLSLLVLLALTEFLFPLLSISVSVFLPGLAGSGIPMPLKYSTVLRGTPWDTFCLIALWLWSGWLWLRSPQSPPEGRLEEAPASAGSAASAEIDAAQLV